MEKITIRDANTRIRLEEGWRTDASNSRWVFRILVDSHEIGRLYISTSSDALLFLNALKIECEEVIPLLERLIKEEK